MGGNRTLLIVLLVLIIVVGGGVGGYLYMQSNKATPAPTEETPPPVEYTKIVVAIQNIPRGMAIKAEDLAIEVQEWPNDHLPLSYYTDITEIDGRLARTDIPRGMPVLPDMIAKPGDMIAAEGSAASLFRPEDRVAYAIPMDVQGGVAWAIRPGDHVDVIAAIEILGIDAESQSKLPQQFISIPGSKEEPVLSGIFGRFETLPNGQAALVYPTTIESSLIVQLTVQDAIVWHLGVWQDEEQKAAAEAAAAAQAAASEEEGGLIGGGEAAQPTPLPEIVEYGDIEPVTLLVMREDALVLKYLIEMGADLDLVLRPAGFTTPVLQTQPVWLRYIVDKYGLPDTAPDMPVMPVAVRTPLQLESIETPEPEE